MTDFRGSHKCSNQLCCLGHRRRYLWRICCPRSDLHSFPPQASIEDSIPPDYPRVHHTDVCSHDYILRLRKCMGRGGVCREYRGHRVIRSPDELQALCPQEHRICFQHLPRRQSAYLSPIHCMGRVSPCSCAPKRRLVRYNRHRNRLTVVIFATIRQSSRKRDHPLAILVLLLHGVAQHHVHPPDCWSTVVLPSQGPEYQGLRCYTLFVDNRDHCGVRRTVLFMRHRLHPFSREDAPGAICCHCSHRIAHGHRSQSHNPENGPRHCGSGAGRNDHDGVQSFNLSGAISGGSLTDIGCYHCRRPLFRNV